MPRSLHEGLPAVAIEKLKQASHFRALAGPHAKAVLAQTARGLFLVDPEDYGVGFDLRMNGAYSEQEIILYETLLNRSSKVLIVGAHVGSIAIPLSKLCHSVTAVEANPATFELLELNLLINRISNCTPVNIAAGDKHEEILFLANRTNSGGSKRFPQISDLMYTYDNPAEIKVQSAPLDELLAGNRYDLIIMDIEGSEYFALRGMTSLLERCSVLVIEFVPHHLKNVSTVTVEEFLRPLWKFKLLTIPTKSLTVPSDQFLTVLQQLYDLGECDDGLIFQK